MLREKSFTFLDQLWCVAFHDPLLSTNTGRKLCRIYYLFNRGVKVEVLSEIIHSETREDE